MRGFGCLCCGCTLHRQLLPRPEPILAVAATVVALVWAVRNARAHSWLLGAAVFYFVMFLPVSTLCAVLATDSVRVAHCMLQLRGTGIP